MKVFVLFLSLCFVLNVVISPTYASEEECTIKASCRTPSIAKTKWMKFVTPDDTAKIEAEVSLLRKNDVVMESEFDKLKKEAGKSKENLDDAMKKIEFLNEKVERMKKDAIESKTKIDDAIKRIVSLENENAGKKTENEGTSKKETSPMTRNENNTTVPCPVIYENKCFIAVIEHRVNYNDGVAVCNSRGSHLANIYSQTHMDDVMKYIRENRMDNSKYIWFRLGMKYNPEAKKMTLRDGTDAPAGLKWHHGTPYTVEANAAYADRTNVILAVASDQSVTHQYLTNYRPSTTTYVLCEIE